MLDLTDHPTKEYFIGAAAADECNKDTASKVNTPSLTYLPSAPYYFTHVRRAVAAQEPGHVHCNHHPPPPPSTRPVGFGSS